MASGSTPGGVRGSVYDLYTTEDVLNLMDGDVDEPMCEYSDDDLGMDLHDSEDETRYYPNTYTSKYMQNAHNTCVCMKLSVYYYSYHMPIHVSIIILKIV